MNDILVQGYSNFFNHGTSSLVISFHGLQKIREYLGSYLKLSVPHIYSIKTTFSAQ